MSRLNRREALTMLAASATSLVRAETAPFHVDGLDHVALTVPAPGKSGAFYRQIFSPIMIRGDAGPRAIVGDRKYIAINSAGAAQQKASVDHIALTIDGYQRESVKAQLAKLGIPVKDGAGQDLFVTDPDGIRIQLIGPGSVDALPREPNLPNVDPIFQPTGFDHVLLDVSNPEKSSTFYEKLLGPVTQRNNNRTWFQVGKSRLGLLGDASQRGGGVNHFCVSAAAFAYDAVLKKLEQAGAKVEDPEVAGAPEFRDPDGILVQVMGPRAATGKK